MKKMNVHTIRLDEVDSTNTYLRRMETLPDADIVVVTAGPTMCIGTTAR